MATPCDSQTLIHKSHLGEILRRTANCLNSVAFLIALFLLLYGQCRNYTFPSAHQVNGWWVQGIFPSFSCLVIDWF